MKDRNIKLEVDNLIATDGFYFSGSSLINDVLIESGYLAPRNIRAEEMQYNRNNFSWPRALNNEYNLFERCRVAIRVLKTILVRLPINIIQKTPIYEKYLNYKGRGIQIHESTSVNRSLWSYFLSLHMLFYWGDFDEFAFVKWIGLKYRLELSRCKNLLLDNGIPSDTKVMDWFFNIQGSLGIIIYRDPRIQYQQIVQLNLAQGKPSTSYGDFLTNLEAQYQASKDIFNKNYNIIPVYFDAFLNDLEYRERLEAHFIKKNILDGFGYDFSESIKNNEALSACVDKVEFCEEDIKKELIIEMYHKFFYTKFIKITEC